MGATCRSLLSRCSDLTTFTRLDELELEVRAEIRSGRSSLSRAFIDPGPSFHVRSLKRLPVED